MENLNLMSHDNKVDDKIPLKGTPSTIRVHRMSCIDSFKATGVFLKNNYILNVNVQ